MWRGGEYRCGFWSVGMSGWSLDECGVLGCILDFFFLLIYGYMNVKGLLYGYR